MRQFYQWVRFAFMLPISVFLLFPEFAIAALVIVVFISAARGAP